MPTLRQLDYLVAIAETRHFRRAAQRCNTSQSTLSVQLKALEERLGVDLVERAKSPVELTAVGLEVVKVARRMLCDAQAIRDFANSHQGLRAGAVTLAIPPTLAPSLLTRVIPLMRRAFPSKTLKVLERSPQELADRLIEGDCDVIIAQLPLRAENIQIVEIFEEPLYLTLANGHPLASNTAVRWDDLHDVEVLALGPEHQLHDEIVSQCAQSGVRLQTDFAGASLESISTMVASGLGVSFLPALYLRDKLLSHACLQSRPIQGHRFSRTIGMAWRQAGAHRSQFKQLADELRADVTAQLQNDKVQKN